jgi:carbon monoxide dehydrogenase subunit G
MATLHQEFEVPAAVDAAWAMLRDFGGLARLAPGFVTACTMEEAGQVRLVTFFNGMQVRERLVTLDDAARRLVYTLSGGRTTHYNGVVELQPLGPQDCRFSWTVDLLPDTLAPAIGQLMRQGAEAMRQGLESSAP